MPAKKPDEDAPRTAKIQDARQQHLISNQAAQIAQFATKALVVAEQLGIKKKLLDNFWLGPVEREVLSLIPGVAKALKKKLKMEGGSYSVGDVASMTLALAEELADGDTRKQVAVIFLAKHLMDHLQSEIAAEAEPKPIKKPRRKPKVASDKLFQFKITLLDTKPSIWRRIQVQDCTLDKLHEHIQTAMGWTNSHLHQFEIKGQRYGDPELLDDAFDDFECVDSTTTRVTEIVPKSGKRFAFQYEYDFGDGWEHEVLCEGRPPIDPKAKYPLCLEGERACPPEDCGGVWGYVDFLEAIRNPKHEEHESMMEWIGGAFNPDEFDPAKATKAMKKGLPDWKAVNDLD
jgi:hypothetical protein